MPTDNSFSRRRFIMRMAGAGVLPIFMDAPRVHGAEPLRLGIVGAGAVGRQFASLAAAAPGATRVCALCDIDPQALRAAARSGGILRGEPKFTSRFEDLLADADIEAVVIATPLSDRAELALRVIDAGKHVLVRPPWTRSSADSLRLAARSRKRGLLAVQAPYSPDWDTLSLADALRGVARGNVRRVFGQLSVRGPGQGPLLDGIEVARRLIGTDPPFRVSAFRAAGPAGDSVLMTCPSGAAAIQRIANAAHADSIDSLHLRIEGDLGNIEVSIQAAESDGFTEGRAGALDSFVSLVRNAVRTDPGSAGFESHAAYQTMTLAAEAIRTGGAVSMARS